MKSPLRAVTTVSLAALTALTACADSPTSPAVSKPAVEADFENLSNRELLIQVLSKLSALEERVDREALAVRARVDSAILAGTALGGPTVAAVAGAGAGVDIEATACAAGESEIKGQVESSVRVDAAADGHAGVDVVGSGAKARLTALARQVASVLPGGTMKLKIELCGKLGAGGGISTALRGSRLPSSPAAVQAASPLQPLLEGLLKSGTVAKIATAASALQMNGSKLNLGLDAITSLTTGDLGFGTGAAASLVNALPLPAGISGLIANPIGVLQRAPEGLQFAVNQLCSQTLFTGELAQLASQGCSLRGQFPTPTEFLGILQGLNGLSSTLGSVQSDLVSACATVNAMLPARVVIPAENVTFPSPIGVVQTFPGFNRAIFPGIGTAC